MLQHLPQRIQSRLIGIDDNLALVLATCVLARRPILILGRHGTGKSTFCDIVAELLGLPPAECAYYDASKDDLVTVAGIPDAGAFEKGGTGELSFLCHSRTIWNKRLVLIDEITRAPQESQNMWLEIVGNRTLFGRPLPCEILVATCNPATYASAFELDEALLDRFCVVCEFPDLRDAPQERLENVVLTNLESPREGGDSGTGRPRSERTAREEVELLRERFRVERAAMLESAPFRRHVARWAAYLVRTLHRLTPEETRVSNRALSEHLAGLACDFLAHHGRPPHAVDCGTASIVARYVLQYRLQLESRIIEQATVLSWEVLDMESLNHDSVERDVSIAVHCGRQTFEQFSAAIRRLLGRKLDANQRMRIEMALRQTARFQSIHVSRLEQITSWCRTLAPSLAPEMELDTAVARVAAAFDSHTA